MKKISILLLSLVVIVNLPIPIFAENNRIGVGSRVIFAVGNDDYTHNTSYSVDSYYEKKLNDNFGLKVEGGYGKVFGENTDYMPIYGYWVTNTMLSCMLMPKLYLPINDIIDFMIGGGIVYTWLESSYSMNYTTLTSTPPYLRVYYGDKVIRDNFLSYAVMLGFNLNISQYIDLGIEGIWNPLVVQGPSGDPAYSSINSNKAGSSDSKKIYLMTAGIKFNVILKF